MHYLQPEPGPQGAVPARKPALLLVDFQQKDRSYFTYEHGPLNEGIARTASLISTARSAGVPIIVVSGRLSREVFPEISSAAGEGAFRLIKRGIDAFREPDLETFLNASDVDSLVMGGWIRHICVMATAREALKRGFSVTTSDEILFGNREMANLVARRTCLDFFRKNCIFHETAADLAVELRRNNGLRGI